MSTIEFWGSKKGYLIRASGLTLVLVLSSAWWGSKPGYEPAVTTLLTIGGLLGNALVFYTTSDRRANEENEELRGRTINVKGFLIDRLSKKRSLRGALTTITAMTALDKAMAWKEDEEWLLLICKYLEDFESRDWGNRKFRIFYGQQVTRRITIYDYLANCIVDSPKQLYLTIRNVYNRLDKTRVALLSIRDIFEDYDASLAEENKEHFLKANLLQERFPHPSESDRERYSYDPPTIRHQGAFPTFVNRKDIDSVFAKMEEVKSFSARLIREGATISFTHMVLSAYMICNQKPIMLITASNTYKDRLKVYSDTPIVTEDEGYLYFGDSSMRPSSEAIPHWIIHSMLFAQNDNRYHSIIHIHNEELTAIAEHSDVRLGPVFIPTIPHYDFGTEQIGREIAKSLLNNQVSGVSVRSHGQWFVGPSFDSVFRAIADAIEASKRD